MKIDIDLVKDNIENGFVEPPTNLNTNEFRLWCDGYAKCYEEIMDVLEGLKEQYGDSTS